MPIHDWTRVDAGVFHHFHGYLVPELCSTLSDGCLPPDYYAMIEQVTGRAVPDVLTLSGRPRGSAGGSGPAGGLAVAEHPPKVGFRERAVARPPKRAAKRVVVRHVSDDRIVAVVEVVSPGNKGNKVGLKEFVGKAAALIRGGVHLLVVDLFPPGRRDPAGIHKAIWSELATSAFRPPPGRPITFASYDAGPEPEAFVESMAVGDPLPTMPLFLEPEVYVLVPLEPAYSAVWPRVPPRYREALTAPPG